MRKSILGSTTLSMVELLIGTIGGAVAWLLHLCTSYFLLTVGCVYGWSGMTAILLIVTVVFAAVALWAAIFAYRRLHSLGTHEDWALSLSAPLKRETFLMAVGSLSSGVFLLVIVAAGLSPLFVPICSEV